MSKFKIGDIVKGISNHYNITNYNMAKGEVINIRKNGYIDIKILEHFKSCEIGEVYHKLRPEYFELIKN